MYLSGFENNELWDIIRDMRIRVLIQAPIHNFICFNNPEDVVDKTTQKDYDNGEIEFIIVWLKYYERFKNVFEKHDVNLTKSFEIPIDYFQTAGELFVYYNLCPKLRYEWLVLYKDLLQNASPDIILQTLNKPERLIIELKYPIFIFE